MNYLNGPYPIRPQPIIGELFLGFVLRLGYTNGRMTLGQIFGDFNAKARIKCFFVKSNDFNAVAPYFSDAINMKYPEFKKVFDDDGLQHGLESITFYRTKIGNPTFCPHCMAKYGYIKASWVHLHENHCNEHQCELMQQCPECKKHQTWESQLFEGCTHCDFKWADAELKTSTLPLYQQTLDSMSSQRRADYLNKLYIYVKFAMRPNDASHCRYRKLLENVEDTSTYFEFAHQLAAMQEVRCEYARHRKRHFASKLGINGGARVLDIINLQFEAANDEFRSQAGSGLCTMQTHRTTLIPKAASVDILTVNRKLHHAQNDAEYHLEWRYVQKKLSMTREELGKIIDAGILAKRYHTTSNQKLCSPGLNDIISLHKQFSEIVKPISSAKGEKLLSWVNTRKALRAKRLLSDLAIAAIQKQIKVYVKDPESFVFQEIHFNEKDVLIFKTAA
jgi:hypothetical protein